ncbi:MAG: hypothetical protein ABSF69_22100 [Polyangiaceae bacterium]|jgi:hypothetical protein
MSFGRDLLLEIIDAAERDPALAERVRRMLGVQRVEEAKEREAIYLRAAEYARRISLAERTVWALVARGLPTIGSGRSRRIDVAQADEWLRGQRDRVDAAIQSQARRAAQRAAAKVSR